MLTNTENRYLRTGLAHSGHFAGFGMEYDDYGDESFPDFPVKRRKEKIHFINDGKYDELCGPVRVIRPAKAAVTNEA